MPKIFIPLMTPLPFRSVSMETNTKTDEAFKQQMLKVTSRYRPISRTFTNLGDIASTIFSNVRHMDVTVRLTGMQAMWAPDRFRCQIKTNTCV